MAGAAPRADWGVENLASITRLRRILARYAGRIRGGIPDAAMVRAMAAGNPAYVLSLPVWGEALAEAQTAAEAVLLDIIARSGTEEIARLGLGFRFDLDNPYAIEAAARQIAALPVGVHESTMRAVRDIVERGFIEGFPPRDMARQIEALRPAIGLDPRRAGALRNYQADLLAGGSSPAEVARLADIYERKLLRQRTETIARTETITAQNAGKQASWEAAREGGLILEGTKREWVAGMGSDRTCEVCISLDAQKVGMDEAFYSPVTGRSYQMPPAHPSCRCTVVLRTELSAEELED